MISTQHFNSSVELHKEQERIYVVPVLRKITELGITVQKFHELFFTKQGLGTTLFVYALECF